MKDLPTCYRRRPTVAVKVGSTVIGGDAPVLIQSMTNTPTLDTDASVAQIESLARAGAGLVRLTAQGVSHARNLHDIAELVRRHGYDVAISADIHFNPAAAFEAALHVDKVRINPGNFVDPARTFKKLSYTDEEYAAETARIETALIPLLERCREHDTALRLGVNHGSLSDRIMSRFGDTPEGMVESAMEFLRVCRKHDFNRVVISIKSSNVTVMVATVRLLVKAMEAEGMSYPLHLGVTEAGDGDDARIKSAVGIGSLLADGIGDTIRVSLAEAPENEIPVARCILNRIGDMGSVNNESTALVSTPDVLPAEHQSVPMVANLDMSDAQLSEKFVTLRASGPQALYLLRQKATELASSGISSRHTYVAVSYPENMSADEVRIAASIDFGALILGGFVPAAIGIDAPALAAGDASQLALDILQATRLRFSKTEYIACPGCGRTLFNLSDTLHRVREATKHLKNLKIGVMGCVVNGPGEMADADYGYVGAAAGKVSLYKGKKCIKQNIPTEDAVGELIALIKEGGDWSEPEDAK